MSLASAQTSVGAGAAVPLHVADNNSPTSILVRNRGAVSVWLGASAVTTGTGFELAAGDFQTIMLDPGEVLYATATSGTQRVDAVRYRASQRAG
jgi:hypothetical protein